MAFAYKPYPDWSWSLSRDQLFRECRRKYYYHYYGSHNGWLREAPPPAKTAYRLKQMTNLYLELGDAVHIMAEQAVRHWQTHGVWSEAATWEQAVRDRLNRAFLDSKDVAVWQQAPKKRKMLHEMYYDGQLPSGRVERIKDRIARCSENFRQSPTLRLLSGPEAAEIVEIEQLNTFHVGPEAVYVKLDLLLKRSGEEWIIVDWKTGLEAEDNERQMLLYALFLHEFHRVPYDRMELRLEYLLTGDSKIIRPGERHVAKEESAEAYPVRIEGLKREIADSARAMKDCLQDAAANQPKPEAYFSPNPERSRCRSCNFRELCEDKII